NSVVVDLGQEVIGDEVERREVIGHASEGRIRKHVEGQQREAAQSNQASEKQQRWDDPEAATLAQLPERFFWVAENREKRPELERPRRRDVAATESAERTLDRRGKDEEEDEQRGEPEGQEAEVLPEPVVAVFPKCPGIAVPVEGEPELGH